MAPGRVRAVLAIGCAGVLMAACGRPPGPGGGTLPPPVDNSAGDPLDPANLPLGDYHLSTSSPAVGSVFACGVLAGGGAFADGPWIHADGTWDSTTKLHVQGTVAWPGALSQVAESGGRRTVTANGLPDDHTTGLFPIQPTDPAYAYDRNPNAIKEQFVDISLPLDPVIAATPSCLPPGPIGYALNGVAIFSGLDATNRDAVAHEIQDHCEGHPQESGLYHYHSASGCMPGVEDRTPTLLGYALDGFGIYNSYDADGTELTDADLDECHGRVSEVPWNGSAQSVYHYVTTRAYPYTLGCFRGTPGA
jgi:hypothetical protein